MKMLRIAAGLALSACFVFAGCTTAQQASASANLAKLQAIVVNGCMVVQPTLTAVAALDPVVAAAATANGLFCATASAITVTDAQSLLSTGIPAIEKAVTDSTIVPANQKPIIMAALGVFQLTVQNAMTVYGQAAPAATAPASAPAASQ
jgi:hypothetical protein